MAPLSAEPRHLLVVLNPTRRRALYTLLYDITGAMRSQLELEHVEYEPHAPGRIISPSNPSEAPLFVSEPRPDGEELESIQPQSTRPAGVPTNLITLREAALQDFDSWRKAVLNEVKKLVTTPDDTKIQEARRKRRETLAAKKSEPSYHGDDLISFGDGRSESTVPEQRESQPLLQEFYQPIHSKFTTLSIVDRKEVLSSVLLLLLAMGNYSANSRVLALYLTSSFELPLSVLVTEETEIAVSLLESAAAAAKNGNTMSAEAELQKRKQDDQTSRYWKVGLASVAGAAVIGITGGLAAPVVAGAIGGLMGTVGLGSVASFLGVFWMNGALVGALFGALGARMTGEMMDNYAKEVSDFRFIRIKDDQRPDFASADSSDQEGRRLRMTIGISGWLTSEEDVTKPWRVLSDETEVFALRYEMKSLLALGNSLDGLATSYAWKFAKVEILRRTVLASLWSALWPAYLLSVAAKLDNPFSLARNRSQKAGRVLADALINKVQGERPVTLVGYSLGARVIYSCLRSLVERKAFGLIDTVILIGAPVPSNTLYWQTIRSVVSGRIINVYSENDYILAFMYRATSLQLGIAGLQEIKGVEGIQNLNLSEEVAGHLRYPGLIGKILTRCGYPDVKDGDRPIEKDEDITLQKQEAGSEMGTLIQLQNLPPEESLRRETTRPARARTYTDELREHMEPEKEERSASNPKRTVVSRNTTAAVSDPLAEPLTTTEDEATTLPQRPSQTAKPGIPAQGATPEEPGTEAPIKSPNQSSPTTTGKDRDTFSAQPIRVPMYDDVDGDPDDDGEEWAGIRMEDNEDNDKSEDGELSVMTYMEPLRIDD